MTKQVYKWTKPEGKTKGLKVLNSFTKEKNEFVTQKDNYVGVYICGPTVYDVSHLGHARTYVGFDMIRRILEEYFNYNVNYVMNITNIDDKIIKRAKENNENFIDLAKKMEDLFFKDMKSLNVRKPDVITRVSDYIQDITDFILKIEENGFAYRSNGSVYFDVTEFQKKYPYPQLVPLGGDKKTKSEEEEKKEEKEKTEKKNRKDFALWKKSKENEPFWESPFGKGRPGWHIECSVMSTIILGEQFDIHSGGVDLKFPHHDNEIAQVLARYQNKTWVNYFLHTGHLFINGMKMSKSLKNFITIDEALKKYTWRQLRFFFLQHKYNSKLDYSENGMENSVNLDKSFSEFFQNVKIELRKKEKDYREIMREKDHQMFNKLEEVKLLVREALLDDFNTPKVILILNGLVSATNTYLTEKPRNKILADISYYITYIFQIFGLIHKNKMGFSTSTTGNTEEVIAPITTALSEFRDKVRGIARNNKTVELLQLCDQIRDDVLPFIGIRLEDRNNEPSVWKFENKEVLLKERDQKIAEKKKKELAKLKRLEEQKKRLEQAKIKPEEMFLKDPRFSKFDEKGIPTHDAKGEELKKSFKKKINKQYNAQKRKHQQYLKKQQNKK
ncbi:cysteine--tRNA ligase [Anaeramoeba flamelloides]|uniref:cysteine--tRNA ligase n=1 Tax=Anaeramoeba flamelloides TaxID=1746091 RepID=A0ABQ8XUX2_9EUKA|nr:cysteine--tRNA ligase [Anaeramoeba flamelloides]